jgi:hypothetical protein
MIQQTGLGGIEALYVFVEHCDSRVAVVAQETAHFSGRMAVVDVQMLQENRVVSRVLSFLAYCPMLVANCATFALGSKQKLDALHRDAVFLLDSPAALAFTARGAFVIVCAVPCARAVGAPKNSASQLLLWSVTSRANRFSLHRRTLALYYAKRVA